MTNKNQNIAKVYRQAGIKGMSEGNSRPEPKAKIAKEAMPNFGIAKNPRMEGETVTAWIARLKANAECPK
jgi:hypothetical protein